LDGRRLEKVATHTWERTLMWVLTTTGKELPETTFRILPGGVRTVGRATGADFIVDATLVSRVHCRLTALLDGGLEVQDLESTNGTFVNGQRVDFARLSSGDRLRVGRVEIDVTKDLA
jgi:pSer/pThr/pTyr-binding forkhead associated (FHA) protein